MRMVPHDPWSFGQLQHEINRLFSNIGDSESSAAMAGWTPAVDIHEFEDRFELFIDLPGVEPQAVDITLDSGVLTITGERAAPAPVGDERKSRRRLERGYGRFHRRFILPDTVDSENVKATGRNGVLEIAIPKQAKAQPRRIEVAA